MKKQIFWVLSLLSISTFYSCSTEKKFSGFEYDPPDVTDTRDREILLPVKKTFTFENSALEIDTEFPSARLHTVDLLDSNQVLFTIEPENHPINNSPWYAFRVKTNEPDWYDFTIDYKSATHRYYPKLSKDGYFFAPLGREYILETDSSITFRIYVGEEPLWVSAQEIRSYQSTHLWTDGLAEHPLVEKSVVGSSAQGRDIIMLRIGNLEAAKNRVVIMGRQHPPEVSSDIFLERFIRSLIDTSIVGSEFLNNFEFVVFPMLNPDGVELGNWRNNANGADLNRDWANFNQPETQIASYVLQSLEPTKPIVYSIDFHSSNENLFYPIKDEVLGKSRRVTMPWLMRIKEQIPNYDYKIEPFDLSAPIFKNWMFRTFGCDGITFEVHDDIHRDFLRTLARISAEELANELSE